MATHRRKAAISFTGGKDSCTVLHLMRAPEVALRASAGWAEDGWHSELRERLAQLEGCEAALLVTFVPAGGKQPFKAHPLEVVQLQARTLGLPHLVLEVEAAPSFLDSYRANIAALREQHGVEVLATGDILDVCNNFMPRAAEGSGVQLLSPLFGVPRGLLLELVWAYGMAPLVTCVNVTKFARAAAAAPAPQQPSTAAAAGTAAKPGTSGAAAASHGEGADGATTSAGAADGEAAEAGRAEQSCSAATAAAGTAAEGSSASATDPPPLPPLLGLMLSRAMHADVLVPAVREYGIDECGEWGEYHTMVTHSSLFSAPLRLVTEARREGDFAYLAVTSAELEPRVMG